MKLQIDTTKCFGHGRCYQMFPDLFDADEQGDGVVRDGVDVSDHLADAREAIESCPELAISLIEDLDRKEAQA